MNKSKPSVNQLFVVIKRKLKAKSLTYRDIAYSLDATEISVKRWFSEERLTVQQLSAIASLLGQTMTELMQEAEEPPLQQLSQEQETELMKDFRQKKDFRLLAILRCVMCNLNVGDIVANFHFTEAECIQYLSKLDRLRIIDLLPNNQIRVRISRDADVLPSGPLKRFFLDRVIPDFLESEFDNPHEDFTVLRASLSAEAIKQFRVYTRRLKRQLDELHVESFATPYELRYPFTVVMMHRDWEPEAFTVLRRKKDRAA